MSRENFEVTREGLKLSYRRFLSDSAGGYTIFLIILIAYLADVPLPGSSAPITVQEALSITPANITTEIAILLGLLLLLMGTAYGLVLNATSWFTLGWLDVIFVNYWFKHRENRLMSFLVYGTYHTFFLERLYRSFLFLSPTSQRINAEKENLKDQQEASFYEQANFFSKLLQNLFPEVSEQTSYLGGLQIFTRNLSFLAFVISIYAFSIYSFAPNHSGALIIGIVSLFGFLLTSVLAGLIGVYFYAAVLFSVYTLYSQYHGRSPSKPQTFEEVVKTLIAASNADHSNKTGRKRSVIKSSKS